MELSFDDKKTSKIPKTVEDEEGVWMVKSFYQNTLTKKKVWKLKGHTPQTTLVSKHAHGNATRVTTTTMRSNGGTTVLTVNERGEVNTTATGDTTVTTVIEELAPNVQHAAAEPKHPAAFMRWTRPARSEEKKKQPRTVSERDALMHVIRKEWKEYKDANGVLQYVSVKTGQAVGSLGKVAPMKSEKRARHVKRKSAHPDIGALLSELAQKDWTLKPTKRAPAPPVKRKGVPPPPPLMMGRKVCGTRNTAVPPPPMRVGNGIPPPPPLPRMSKAPPPPSAPKRGVPPPPFVPADNREVLMSLIRGEWHEVTRKSYVNTRTGKHVADLALELAMQKQTKAPLQTRVTAQPSAVSPNAALLNVLSGKWREQRTPGGVRYIDNRTNLPVPDVMTPLRMNARPRVCNTTRKATPSPELDPSLSYRAIMKVIRGEWTEEASEDGSVRFLDTATGHVVEDPSSALGSTSSTACNSSDEGDVCPVKPIQPAQPAQPVKSKEEEDDKEEETETEDSDSDSDSEESTGSMDSWDFVQ